MNNNNIEIWADCIVNNNYTISNFGGFKNKKFDKLINGFNRRGYIRVQLQNKSNFTLHRLIFFSFNASYDYYDKKIIIDHIDRDTSNNNLINLRMATRSENNSNREPNKKKILINGINEKNIYFIRGLYVVKISKNKIVEVYKSFKNLDEAIIYRNQQVREIFGDFSIF